MTGLKTNERPGTRAQVRYLRMSPFKARVVLDLIRGKDVQEAAEILAYSERLAAREIGKVLRSAVANAVHNDEIPVDELYVSACYADEGPTLKRFRPRARGRAGRIAKRTCHITVIVSRLSDEELDDRRNRDARRGTTRDEAAARRARVAKSRAAEEAADGEDAEAEESIEAEVDEDVADAAEPAEDTTAEDTTAEDTTAEDTTAEDTTAEDTTAEDTAAADGEDAGDTDETEEEEA